MDALDRNGHRSVAVLRSDAGERSSLTEPRANEAIEQAGRSRWLQTQLHGIETNLAYLAAGARALKCFVKGGSTTRFLAGFEYKPATVEVLQPGTHSSIQEFPGRVGYWNIGVPPSGPDG